MGLDLSIAMNDILVPISPGELIDKVTILRIKSARLADELALRNVRLELALLEHTWVQSGCAARATAADAQALQRVNEELWEVEERIRAKEAARCFDAEFIELARSVYRANDERAAIKKRINVQLGSRIVEEKSYHTGR